MSWAWVWNHRASWAQMLTSISVSFGMLRYLSQDVTETLAFIFCTLGIVLNGFPDITKE